MSDWEEQLSSILGDPQQMGKIADLARSLMGGEAPETAPGDAMPDGIAALLRSAVSGGNDNTTALLEAMKPWLSEKRRAKLDRAMKLSRMAKLAELAMGEGEQRDV